MKRALAALAAAVLWFGGSAVAEARVYSFAGDHPPEALAETSMAVAEGETDVTLTFAGDCTLGGDAAGAKRFARAIKAEGAAFPFANLQSLFAKDDLTLVNLEGVLSDRKLDRVPKSFNFKGSTDYTQILVQGSVEAVTLANNHAMDYGDAGKADTVAALNAANIAYCDENTVLLVEKNGVRIGITASVMGLDQAKFERQAEALRALGCTAIVHVMHMGVEYARAISPAQRSTARFLAANGVALIVGHHPHVAQGLEVIGNTMVAYSLGNCVFGGNADPKDYDAATLRATFHFSNGALESVTVTLWPIRVSGKSRGNDYQPVLLSGADAARVIDKMQATSAFTLAPFLQGQGAVQPEVSLR
ncbi:MAG TPA: CapA family protein [Candidatus Limiplasma sp.]|nr:CapA family protein [Candidatus Limiplasma sp.]HPS81126.1 CapA family protein [Candidatus Limiplasma sp.]